MRIFFLSLTNLDAIYTEKNPKRMKYLMYLEKFKQIQEILITVLEVFLATEVLFYPMD